MPERRSVEVVSRDGGRIGAYLARPDKGSGPGLVLLQEIFGVTRFMRDMADYFAEEGYVVAVPDLFWRLEPGVELADSGEDLEHALALAQRFDVRQGVQDVADTIAALRDVDGQVGKVGVVGYCMGGLLAALIAAGGEADCAVAYYPTMLQHFLDEVPKVQVPLVIHLAAEDPLCPPEDIATIEAAAAESAAVEVVVHAGAGHAFANPTRAGYQRGVASIAYSRTLAVLRRVLGPYYDLSALWDQHLVCEFALKDTAATMGTMVAQPYVNNVPTATGGVGYETLARFYKYHFLDDNPDAKIIPISRTVGSDRLVDESISCFVHDREIPWMLPGIPPTGRYVEVPIVAVVSFRGDKLYNEHIYWDHASLLAQLGLIDQKLPVAGVLAARTLRGEEPPDNRLMGSWADSAGKPAP